jgi:hypothetical protein
VSNLLLCLVLVVWLDLLLLWRPPLLVARDLLLLVASL